MESSELAEQVLQMLPLDNAMALYIRLISSVWRDAFDVTVTTLRINGNSLLGHATFTTRFPNLNTITLTHEYPETALQTLVGFTALNSLNLSNFTTLTNDGLQELASLTALTSLDLTQCGQVTDGLQHLASLTSLTRLNLTNCFEITNNGLQALSSLTSLTSLTFATSLRASHRRRVFHIRQFQWSHQSRNDLLPHH